MLYQPKLFNDERIKVGKQPFTEEELRKHIREWSSRDENSNRMRDVDEWLKYIVSLP